QDPPGCAPVLRATRVRTNAYRVQTEALEAPDTGSGDELAGDVRCVPTIDLDHDVAYSFPFHDALQLRGATEIPFDGVLAFASLQAAFELRHRHIEAHAGHLRARHRHLVRPFLAARFDDIGDEDTSDPHVQQVGPNGGEVAVTEPGGKRVAFRFGIHPAQVIHVDHRMPDGAFTEQPGRFADGRGFTRSNRAGHDNGRNRRLLAHEPSPFRIPCIVTSPANETCARTFRRTSAMHERPLRPGQDQRRQLLEEHADRWLALAIDNILLEYPHNPWIIATGPES